MFSIICACCCRNNTVSQFKGHGTLHNTIRIYNGFSIGGDCSPKGALFIVSNFFQGVITIRQALNLCCGVTRFPLNTDSLGLVLCIHNSLNILAAFQCYLVPINSCSITCFQPECGTSYFRFPCDVVFADGQLGLCIILHHNQVFSTFCCRSHCIVPITVFTAAHHTICYRKVQCGFQCYITVRCSHFLHGIITIRQACDNSLFTAGIEAQNRTGNCIIAAICCICYGCFIYFDTIFCEFCFFICQGVFASCQRHRTN